MLHWHEPASWALVYTASEWLIRLAMLVVVPLRRTPAAAKGWLLLIFFLPWVGLLLYWLIGRATPTRYRQEQFERIPEAFAAVFHRLREHPSRHQPSLDPEFAAAVQLAMSLGHLSILGGNAAEVLVNYDASIDRLVADIDSAKHDVHLLFYLYADDATAGRVTDALLRAVTRGVRCRVLMDAVGSKGALRTLAPRMEAAGIAVHAMLPTGLFRRRAGRFDLRNHRKIAVIDGSIGFTGSQNLVDASFKEGITYEELVVRVSGPVVAQLQLVFAVDWYLETEEVLDSAELFPPPVAVGTTPAQVLASGPNFPTQNNQRLIVALLYGAQKRVVITSPYFIPDEAFLQALQTAVLRGVEVHLVVSEKMDQLLVGLAQRSYYDELLGYGVQVHLYRSNFLHAKHLSVDDAIAMIGSSNMDIRSFVLNAEISMLFYDPGVAARLRGEQERYFAGCETLSLEKWRQRSRALQFCENLARLVSPLL